MKKILILALVMVLSLFGLTGSAYAEEVPAVKPLVALTFDDGPDPIRTPIILAQLAATNTRATFFLLGQNVKKYPAIVKAIQRGGHAIGNHGWDHQDFSNLTYEQARKQIADTNAEIKKVTGVEPVLFRYPYGNESATGNAAIRDLGMWGGILWHWEHNPVLKRNKVFTGDWDCDMSASDVQKYIVANAVDQGLILLHDAGDSSDCGPAHFTYVAPAVKELRKKGYEFGVAHMAYQGSYVNQWSWVQVVK